MIGHQPGDLGEFRCRPQCARRIAGRVQHQELGFLGEGGGNARGGSLVAFRDAGRQDDGGAAGKLHGDRVGDPEGCQHDDFIARLDERHDGVDDDLLGAIADADLGGVIVETVLRLELAGERLAEFRQSLHGGVVGEARGHGGGRRFLDVERRVEVGLAQGEADDVLAPGAQIARALGHAADGALVGGGGAGGEKLFDGKMAHGRALYAAALAPSRQGGHKAEHAGGIELRVFLSAKRCQITGTRANE